MTTRTYVIRTLGCKANLVDSQLLERELQSRGWKAWRAGDFAPVEKAALCVINSCSVTDQADRETRRLAARLSREHPEAAVVVTGCTAEIDPERLIRSRGIHYVIGNRDKPRLVDLILERLSESSRPLEEISASEGEILGLAAGYERMASRHPMDREWPSVGEALAAAPAADSEKTRTFLKIQEGCNSFCTYCVIPYGRGPSRSLPEEAVVAQVRDLVAQGVREVILTGTNIGDYGTDAGGKPRLLNLLESILGKTSLQRLRISSLDPVEISAEVTALAASELRFCPHFHVSLQSPHSRILRLMKRPYGLAEVRECLERIARIPAPLGGPFVGMDVITGFPGETLAEFEESYKTLEALPWSRLHVFPYSEREGTPATRLPGSVPREERVRRTRLLNTLSLERGRTLHERALAECLSKGFPLTGILVERAPKSLLDSAPDAEWIAGYTTNYLRVFVACVPGAAPERNSIVAARPERLSIDEKAGDLALIARLAIPAQEARNLVVR